MNPHPSTGPAREGSLRTARRHRRGTRAVWAILAASGAAWAAPDASPPATWPAPAAGSLSEAVAARNDLWGDAARRQPGGPSYAFFADLLPPLRYCNAAFRHYPIVLSAPQAAVKVRLVSDGSAIHARAGKSTWRDMGFPVTFSVGAANEVFGTDPDRLRGPRYESGYLPIVRLDYDCASVAYGLEVFAAVEPALSACGAAMVRLSAAGPGAGRVAARPDAGKPVTAADGAIRDGQGRVLMTFDARWRWRAADRLLEADLPAGQSAVLAIFTAPAPPETARVTPEACAASRQACAEKWKELLARSLRLEVPEAVVMNAWRALVTGTFMLAAGDRMNYSVGNLYERLCEAESGDAVRALMLFGYTDEARAMVGPLLDFDRHITRFHLAGVKLQLLSHYYWVTRDAETVRDKRPVWSRVVAFLEANRDASCGLIGKDNYAADIPEEVFSFKSNANCFKGLRDFAAVLADVGERDEAARIGALAADLRRSLREASRQGERHEVDPPFIPMALLAGEAPYDPLTASRKGSYYSIISPYVLASGVFDPGSPQEQWLLDYPRRRGGLCMGLPRCNTRQGGTQALPGVNPVYALRRQLTLLRRNEREEALVCFYGHLAQGLTRDTFIGGEGSRLVPLDPRGRELYMPPNCTSNALFLMMLRYLLVQDWDADNDGVPETLRLLAAAPARWLEDGAAIRLERAPTMFGPVSLEVRSRLRAGEVTARVTAPPRPVRHFSLRFPLPEGFVAAGAECDGQPAPAGPDATVDLTGRPGAFTVRLRATKAAADR